MLPAIFQYMKSIGREEATQRSLMVKKLKKIISNYQDAHKSYSGICKEVDKDKKIVDWEFTMCLALGDHPGINL